MDRKEFAKRAAQRPFILDGATGSNLMRAGMPSGVCPETWILENKRIVSDLQLQYAESGADAVTAPTFGANRNALKRYSLDPKIEQINRELAEISKVAVCGKALTAADISPTGLFLKPFGDADFDEIYAVFEEQARILDNAGVDLFIIETQMNLAETRAAVLAVKSFGKPTIAMVTVDEKGLTMSGNPAEVCFLVLSSLGADAVGLNCSVGPDRMCDILIRGMEYTYAPLAAKANAGKPHGEGADMHFDISSADFSDACAKMIAAGVRVIGGCCGTTPDYIREISQKLQTIEIPEYKVPDKGKLSRFAANDKRIFTVSADNITLPERIICSSDLEDDISDALDDDPDCIRVFVRSAEDADILSESAYLITVPLVIGGENPRVLADALKKYPGRAILDPQTEFSRDEIDEIIDIYNPVLLM